MHSTAFTAAVSVLRQHFKTTDGTPIQISALDLRHLAHSLFDKLPPRTVSDSLIGQLLRIDSDAESEKLLYPREDMLAECERILFATEITQIDNAKFVAACLYFHYSQPQEKS